MPRGVPAVSPVCSVEGCGRAHQARGLCSAHYGVWRVNHDPVPCVIEGCGRPRYNTEHGWCTLRSADDERCLCGKASAVVGDRLKREGTELDIDAVAKAMYETRPRNIAWEDLSEVGWKAEYRRMAEAAVKTMGLQREERSLGDGAAGFMFSRWRGEGTHYVRPQTRQWRWVGRWNSLARV